LKDLWDSIKHTDFHFVGFQEREGSEKEAENLFEEIIAKNFPNLGKETDIHIHKAQRAPNKMNQGSPC